MRDKHSIVIVGSVREVVDGFAGVLSKDEYGFEVSVFYDADEFLRKYNLSVNFRKSIDVILSGLILEKDDSCDILKLIRSDAAGSAVQVIIMSSRNEEFIKVKLTV
ncbi:MAG: hypothetical protein LBP35_01400 [Candidatus Ancillula trichonymphae]|nr:hypothetical protein [Candidatus Ancillula trichonymphae]